MPVCAAIAATANRPSSPPVISAPRQPIVAINAVIAKGAAANPTLPLNVCSAKDRPITSLRIEPVRMA